MTTLPNWLLVLRVQPEQPRPSEDSTRLLKGVNHSCREQWILVTSLSRVNGALVHCHPHDVKENGAHWTTALRSSLLVLTIWPVSKSLRSLGLPISPTSNTFTTRTNSLLTTYAVQTLTCIQVWRSTLFTSPGSAHNVLAHRCIWTQSTYHSRNNTQVQMLMQQQAIYSMKCDWKWTYTTKCLLTLSHHDYSIVFSKSEEEVIVWWHWQMRMEFLPVFDCICSCCLMTVL